MFAELTKKSASSRPFNSSTACASKNSFLLRIAILYLFIAATFTQQSHSQMTFSDGWGKRSVQELKEMRLPPLVISNEETNRLDKSIINAELHHCDRAFTYSHAKLHEKIMNLYDTYQQCQNRIFAAANLHNQQV